ncbi:MAG TPA: ATP-binding protein [Pirellulales bacterium]|nr:ATP-binding protein [Pirellulales bacterium]
MHRIADLSINAKLKLLVLLASGSALALSCLAFVINDVRMIRSSTIAQLSALASVLGSNSTAALTFDDPATAGELLKALSLQPSIESACIYDQAGKPFALYKSRAGIAAPPLRPSQSGSEFSTRGFLDLWEPIIHQGEQVGTICVRSNMEELHAQLLRYAQITILVLFASLVAAFLLSSRWQATISQPILDLAETAERISAERDYSIRVTRTANDELGTLYDQFNAMLEEIRAGEKALHEAHAELEQKVIDRTQELSTANAELSREIAERRRAEKALESTHQQLVDAARRAGMAEIATGVLHNVGNVLNSVNVSASLVNERMRRSKGNQLTRMVQLLEQHAHDLGDFVTHDTKGKQVPAVLKLIDQHLAEERADVSKELENLLGKVEHIKTIVATQQSYACVSGVVENVGVLDALDDALRLNSSAFDRHHIEVIRNYDELQPARLDKQKLLQILVNLLKNAKEALAASPKSDRRLALSASRSGSRLIITVRDNGVGIARENLTRIFSHGFTTKPKGHGFGLHGCANAATEMGGSLTVESEGVGKGATFTLDLPYMPQPATIASCDA